MRWLSLDPQARDFSYESNYAYVSNNPNIYVDPDGEAKIYILHVTDRETGEYLGSIGVILDNVDVEKGVHKYKEDFAGQVVQNFTFHDINITQNVIMESDGSFTMNGDPVTSLGDEIVAEGAFEWHVEAGIAIGIFDGKLAGDGDVFDLTGDGETTSQTGVEFTSKKARGSGVRSKHRGDKIATIDADPIIEFIEAGKGISKGRSGEKTKRINNRTSPIKMPDKITPDAIKDLLKNNKKFFNDAKKQSGRTKLFNKVENIGGKVNDLKDQNKDSVKKVKSKKTKQVFILSDF